MTRYRHPFSGAITSTKCPECKKFGLQGRFHKLRGNEFRCRECNSFFDGERADKLRALVDKNVLKKRSKKYSVPYYKRFGLV